MTLLSDKICHKYSCTHMYLYACVGSVHMFTSVSVNCMCPCLFQDMGSLLASAVHVRFQLFPSQHYSFLMLHFLSNLKYSGSQAAVNFLLPEAPLDKIKMLPYLRVIQEHQKFHVTSSEFIPKSAVSLVGIQDTFSLFHKRNQHFPSATILSPNLVLSHANIKYLVDPAHKHLHKDGGQHNQQKNTERLNLFNSPIS